MRQDSLWLDALKFVASIAMLLFGAFLGLVFVMGMPIDHAKAVVIMVVFALVAIAVVVGVAWATYELTVWLLSGLWHGVRWCVASVVRSVRQAVRWARQPTPIQTLALPALRDKQRTWVCYQGLGAWYVKSQGWFFAVNVDGFRPSALIIWRDKPEVTSPPDYRSPKFGEHGKEDERVIRLTVAIVRKHIATGTPVR